MVAPTMWLMESTFWEMAEVRVADMREELGELIRLAGGEGSMVETGGMDRGFTGEEEPPKCPWGGGGG